ncbi:MAG: phosphoesterase, partial [Flavobacteriaceae bacterium]|nr:phosphoesterase [Flavobacteriaceae bacterium]
VYGEELNNIEWFNKEGVILDRALIQRSGRAQWKFLADYIQNTLTDEVIDEAFQNIPREVRNESLAEIIEKLKARRNNLVNIAEEYYNYLATLQTVTGTDRKDVIEITRFPDGNTKVVVSRPQVEGSKVILERTFKSTDTKEIWIYALDGQDQIIVQGDPGKSSIFLRIVGGQENDTYSIKSGTNVKVYDYQSKPDTILEKNGGTVRFTDIYDLNTYDYRKQIRKESVPAAAIGYNPDQGTRIGLQYVIRRDGFQRNPFSQRHQFSGAYFTDIENYELSYNGEFANVQDDRNINFGVRITNPAFQVNYFGYGNETMNLENIDGFGYEANRVEIQNISGHVALLRNSNFGSFFKVQTKFDAYTINSNFVPNINAESQQQLRETNYFATIEGIYQYRSYDDARNPSRGMMFDLNTGLTDNLKDMSRLFGFLRTRLGFYNALTADDKWVLKTNVEAAFNFDNKFEFYQGIQLGANTGLRGYRMDRFTGKSSLVGSADLRYSFNEFSLGLIPIQIGIYAGADLGRVWIPSATSDKWHNDYGGGLWIHGSGGLNANASLFRSVEGTRAEFGVGFSF